MQIYFLSYLTIRLSSTFEYYLNLKVYVERRSKDQLMENQSTGGVYSSGGQWMRLG